MGADDLEPVLAHGARMSWAGLLRPGDPFPASARSRRVVVTAERGPPLHRFFGGWSSAYRRFTSNLSTPELRVTVVEPNAPPTGGIEGILHWVAREDVLGSGPGSVARGDGWPTAIWDAFLAARDHLGTGSVGEQLRRFADARTADDGHAVDTWRRMLRDATAPDASAADVAQLGWIPVPARLDGAPGSTTCLASWSPSPLRFESLTTALRSPFAEREGVDVDAQARYYLECRLAALHGIRFSADDALTDRAFEAGPSVRERRAAWTTLEEQRIGDPRFGRLDRRDPPGINGRRDR